MNLKAGQWVKCVKNNVVCITKDKWYEIKEFIRDTGEIEIAIYPDDFAKPHRICYSMQPESAYLKYFDLNNPLDYNPMEQQ